MADVESQQPLKPVKKSIFSKKSESLVYTPSSLLTSDLHKDAVRALTLSRPRYHDASIKFCISWINVYIMISLWILSVCVVFVYIHYLQQSPRRIFDHQLEETSYNTTLHSSVDFTEYLLTQRLLLAIVVDYEYCLFWLIVTHGLVVACTTFILVVTCVYHSCLRKVLLIAYILLYAFVIFATLSHVLMASVVDSPYLKLRMKEFMCRAYRWNPTHFEIIEDYYGCVGVKQVNQQTTLVDIVLQDTFNNCSYVVEQHLIEYPWWRILQLSTYIACASVFYRLFSHILK